MSGPASFDRPAGASVLRELHGRVGAAADLVFDRLQARVDPRGESAFAADTVTRRAVVQGEYWYRGEYAVEPDGDGARVVYTIINVAPGWRMLGALTGRAALRAAPDGFAHLLEELA